MAKKVTYSEPADFIPKSVRKELGLGEYSPAAKSSSTKSSSKGAKTTKTK